jgi:hypothetical protein
MRRWLRWHEPEIAVILLVVVPFILIAWVI